MISRVTKIQNKTCVVKSFFIHLSYVTILPIIYRTCCQKYRPTKREKQSKKREKRN